MIALVIVAWLAVWLTVLAGNRLLAFAGFPHCGQLCDKLVDLPFSTCVCCAWHACGDRLTRTGALGFGVDFQGDASGVLNDDEPALASGAELAYVDARDAAGPAAADCVGPGGTERARAFDFASGHVNGGTRDAGERA